MGFDPRATACPHTRLTRSCHEARMALDCPKWLMFQGVHPNTGETVAEWACADRWLPFLLADTNRRLVGVQSAVETRGDAAQEQQARVATLIERASARAGGARDGADLDALPRRVAASLPAVRCEP